MFYGIPDMFYVGDGNCAEWNCADFPWVNMIKGIDSAYIVTPEGESYKIETEYFDNIKGVFRTKEPIPKKHRMYVYFEMQEVG